MFWFPNCSDTKQTVQLHKTARGLKFLIKEVEGLYYLCSENKGAGNCEAELCLFSHMQNVGLLMMRLMF